MILYRISAGGVESLIVAILEEGDVSEDEAARRLADAIGLNGVTLSVAGTGRVNFHANTNGVFCVARGLVDAINRIDPGITLATLENLEPVLSGRMVATVKVIPYAIPGEALQQAEKTAAGKPVLSVEPYRPHRVGVISTLLPGLKASIVEKTIKVLEKRLSPSGSRVIDHRKVPHSVDGVAQEIETLRDECDLVIVFGASAICDENDVIPAALIQAGGHVERVGMPVDPGNLLMLGAIGSIPVIGAPGCARSPARQRAGFCSGAPVGGDRGCGP